MVIKIKNSSFFAGKTGCFFTVIKKQNFSQNQPSFSPDPVEHRKAHHQVYLYEMNLDYWLGLLFSKIICKLMVVIRWFKYIIEYNIHTFLILLVTFVKLLKIV